MTRTRVVVLIGIVGLALIGGQWLIDPGEGVPGGSVSPPVGADVAEQNGDGSVTPGDPATPHSPPPIERRGLLFTPAEVEIWRERAQEGPYRVSGDVSPNSPGDWDRILDNTERFADDPVRGRWHGPSQGDLDTCVQQLDDPPPVTGPAELRDAAFYALVTGATDNVEAIRRELLWQAQQPGTDFSDRDRWCTRVLIDVNPSFDIANWLTQLLFAYDYLGPDAFTDTERETLDRWFADSASFLQVDLDRSLEQLFVARGEDEALDEARPTGSGCDRVLYLNGPEGCSIHRHYNNRRAAIARHIGLVGVHQDDASLRRSARLFVEEFLKYGMFPDGSMSDFERWTTSNPDLGWAYAANTLAPVLVIADAFARAGDPSLYEYTTSAGTSGSEGGPKDLRFAARALGRYVDGAYRRYGTDAEAERGDAAFLIDGRNVATGWYGVHDISVAVANVYYRDSYLEGAYTRTGPDMGDYPQDPASNGPHTMWAGEGGIFPGVLFMYGQMEDEVWPY